MVGLNLMAEAGESVLENGVGTNAESAVEVASILPMIKAGVMGVFDIATSAFNFLLSTPLSAFMLGSGFAFTALSLARKALRVSKRS